MGTVTVGSTARLRSRAMHPESAAKTSTAVLAATDYHSHGLHSGTPSAVGRGGKIAQPVTSFAAPFARIASRWHVICREHSHDSGVCVWTLRRINKLQREEKLQVFPMTRFSQNPLRRTSRSRRSAVQHTIGNENGASPPLLQPLEFHRIA